VFHLLDPNPVTLGALGDSLEKSPATKLLSFYEALVDSKQWASLQTVKTMKESEKLRNLEGIKPEWIKIWAKGWVS
jgi:hypothetical protein